MSEYINNQTKRKRVIQQLHEGRTVEEVQDEFAAGGRREMDIAEIEQELMRRYGDD